MKKILDSTLMGIMLLFVLTIMACEAGLQSNSGSGSEDDTDFSFSDMYKKISTMQQEIDGLNQKIQTLEAINNGMGSRIVNVTVHENSVRRVLPVAKSITMEDFVVEKKSPTSILLIQGTISGRGKYSGDMQQGWQYGSSSEVRAQSMMYESSHYSKIYSTTAVIAGHGTTGDQNLKFRYYANNNRSAESPFVYYNPNSSDDSRIGQTRSVYIVWEIEP
ncbi:MAG: hypothetical protein GY754_37645 [bacterium]|nr:hypothetical protein [bacterium]